MDICAKCGLGIEWSHLRGMYANVGGESYDPTPFVCPTDGGLHEPSYAVG